MLIRATMKHYILLWVVNPGQVDDEKHAKWLTLAQRLEHLTKTPEGTVQLGEGAWLLPRNQGMRFAAECVVQARLSNLTAQVRFLSGDDEPGA